MELAPEIYKLTRRFPSEERFGLTSQMRRAVVSVAANIAEGQGRNHPGEFRQFLGIARGSLAELDTLLITSVNLALLSQSDCDRLTNLIIEIRRPLQGLIQSIHRR
jgi:four helix bundle protein